MKHCLISRLSTWRDICKRTLSGHWILPRNSEAKAATQQNDNTQNAKHHDAYNVPINEYRLASAMSAFNFSHHNLKPLRTSFSSQAVFSCDNIPVSSSIAIQSTKAHDTGNFPLFFFTSLRVSPNSALPWMRSTTGVEEKKRKSNRRCPDFIREMIELGIVGGWCKCKLTRRLQHVQRNRFIRTGQAHQS